MLGVRRGVVDGAHPRVGGENPASVYLVGFLVGSSPRRRGKRDGGAAQFGDPRLIPA